MAFMKGIIMAGGEGTRLRPLTCDCPKPMIRLMNRPVMQYALALLKKHGVTQVAATLGYLPDAITDYFGGGDDFGVDLRYSIEKTPLGTAGGVKQAADFLDETFVVLSGDGITDLDIAKAAAFHRQKGALATLVLKHANNPLDYGVVCADADGRVRSFHEKPNWSDVLSDTVNTGIYILEPEALSRIPEGRAFDFGHDLFPALVAEGAPVYGYVMSGYWCDIGDVRAYLAAHADALEGRIRVPGLCEHPGRVVQLPGAMIDRAAVLEGPCLIGANARVLSGAHVGPYSVIGEGCVIGEGASVKRAVLWPGARLDAGAQARGCVLAAGARLEAGAQAYEEAALGTGASLGARAALLPGVKLWPGKRGADGARIDANVVWGNRPDGGFSNGMLPAADPARMARAAQAVVAETKPAQWLLGRADGEIAAALWHAAAAGAMAQGAQVVDAGAGLLPQLRYLQRRLRCDAAAWVTPEGIVPLDEHGARLLTRRQRGIAAQLARQDFPAPFAAGTRPVIEAGQAALGYAAEAAAQFSADPAGAPPVALFSEDEGLLSLAERAFTRAGLSVRAERDAKRMALAPEEIGVCLDAGGERGALCDAQGMPDDAGRQLMAAWTALEAGERTLILPVQATRAIERLAAQYGARTEYVAGERALWMHELAARQPERFALWFDGIAGSLAMLGALVNARLTLDQWRQAMPAVARRSRSVPVAPGQAGRALHALAQREQNVELGGGMRLLRDDGWAWVCPDDRRPELRIVAEAANAEIARELCDFCERELRKWTGSRQ